LREATEVSEIRDATVDDCEALSAVAFASKSHWGYDDAFMEACRDELTIRPVHLERAQLRVAVAPKILGFYGIKGDELEWMFVAPSATGRGIGRALFTDALDIARASGVETLRIDSDPNAAGFYERMGARRIGETPSASIPGRVLPVYVIGVSSTT
jgi:GNAT superfamily N-acetyltransferase